MRDEFPDTGSPAHRSSRDAHRRITDRSLLAVALILFALNLWRYGAYLLDDTFISFRYAENLVAGNGLVFNPGERVEGYTNFLFVLIAALCLWLGVDPVAATKAVGLACTVALLSTLARLARPRGTLAMALLLPLPGFAYWAAASFETMIFASIAFAAVAVSRVEYQRRTFRGAVFAFVLLALTRPEGVLLFALATTIFFAATAWRRSPAWRLALGNAAVFALGYGAYFAWRYAYYGDLVPNTFRAKVTGGWGQLLTGAQYLGTWARTYPLLAAALIAPLAGLSPRLRAAMRVDAWQLALYAVAASYALYVTFVGGDFMPFHRFFVPLLPWCCLMLTWTLAALPRGWPARIVPAMFALHVVCGYLTEEPYRAFVAHRTAVVGQRVGERLARHLDRADVIAVNTAGALPYFSRQPAIDMLGLTDATIAQRPVFIVSPGWAGHRRGWGAYVLDRRPRVIFFYNASGSREPFYLSDHELADNPYFRFFYQLKTFTVPAPDDGGVPVGRFLGFPFGFDASGRAPWRDLGLESRFEARPLAHTVLYDGATVAHYFELDSRDATLWTARQAGNVDGFLGTVAQAWARIAPPPSDPSARAPVEALCAAAYEKIQAGDVAAAKTILTTAARQNGSARSPLVYQYIANVAVLDGDLFTAVAAQKEALRIAPDNDLYRRNLLNLLQKPYE